MTTSPLPQDLKEGQDPAEKSEQALPTRRRAAGALRMAAVGAPLLLFAAATLSGLVFFATLQPIFGTIALALGAAAGLLSILAAMFVPNS